MNEKINNLKHIEYLANFDFLSTVLLEWHERKKNKTVSKMIDALLGINYYVTANYDNERHFKTAMSEYRSAKLRALERARLADVKIRELEKELEILKKKNELGL